MIVLLALLRIVPYALAGLLAWQKGYKRLSLAMAFVIFIALLTAAFDPSAELRATMASIFALLIGWHAADLKPKS